MEYLLVAIIGWCGTYWPRRFPLPGGGGYPNPDDPWPPYCPVCGPIIGAIAAVAMLLPISFHLEPTSAIILLAGMQSIPQDRFR